MPRKSKCHQERRNSPSVASCSPVASCFLTTFSISRSSIALSSAAEMAPFSRLARASLSAAGRRKLPTWSARNGGLVLFIARTPGGQSSARKAMADKPPSTIKRGRLSRPSPWDQSHPWRAAARSMPGPAAAGAPRAPGGGDAEMALQHRAVGGEIGARRLVDHHAALDDRRPVGDAQHLLSVLLDQDRRHALVADDAPQRLQQLLDQNGRASVQRI